MSHENISRQSAEDNNGRIFHKPKAVNIILTVLGMMVVLLHLYGAFFPSSENWGMHVLAFFPPVARALVLLLMISLLLPLMQSWLLKKLQQGVHFAERQAKLFRTLCIVLLPVLSGAVFWIWRERTFFLGDGFMIIRWLPIIKTVEDIPQAFKHEPFTGFIMWNFYRLLATLQITSNPEVAIQWTSILFGVGFVAVLLVLVRDMMSDAIDRVLLFLFIFTAGGSQLFFGYVENYAPAYSCFLLYITVSVAYVRGKCSLLIPSAVFGILLTLNLGMLCMAPSLALLCYYEIRSRHIMNALLSCVASVTMSVLILWLCHYPLSLLYEVFFRGDSHIVPWREAAGRWQAYTLFSSLHFLELANLFLLLSPFAVVLCIAGPVLSTVKSILRTPDRIFVSCAGLCGIVFLFIVNTDLGMSRDWDLLSSFTVGIIIAAAWYMVAVEPAQTRRRLLIVVVGIMALHTSAWIMVNADEERSLARIHLLPDERLWGKNAFRMYEEVAMYYRDRNDYRMALEYYEKYLRYDSTDARIFGNIADVCSVIGDEQKESYYNQKAIQLGSTSAGVYLNQGIVCANSNRFEEAIPLLKKSLVYNPNQPPVVNMIGAILLRSKEDYKNALPLFQQTLQMDSTYALAYLNAGVCYYHLHDAANAKSFLSKFLELQPSYRNAEEIRRMIQAL